MNNSLNKEVIVSKDDINKGVVKEGYKFFSGGEWFDKGSEAFLLFTLSGGKDYVSAVENYILMNEDPSGLFRGIRKESEDEESCLLSEFNIYKNGVLIKKAEEVEED